MGRVAMSSPHLPLFSSFSVEAIRPSWILHSSTFCSVACVRKTEGAAQGEGQKCNCRGRIQGFKRGAVSSAAGWGRGEKELRPLKRGALGKCSVLSKEQIYCSLPGREWPAGGKERHREVT